MTIARPHSFHYSNGLLSEVSALKHYRVFLNEDNSMSETDIPEAVPRDLLKMTYKGRSASSSFHHNLNKKPNTTSRRRSSLLSSVTASVRSLSKPTTAVPKSTSSSPTHNTCKLKKQRRKTISFFRSVIKHVRPSSSMKQPTVSAAINTDKMTVKKAKLAKLSSSSVGIKIKSMKKRRASVSSIEFWEEDSETLKKRSKVTKHM